MIHQLRHPWEMALAEKSYYYCDDPACRIIYFDEDDETITIDQLRTPVGVKSDDADATICYCFGVSKSDAIADPSAKSYVVAQTKNNLCACEARNPFGRCCLKDFPK